MPAYVTHALMATDVYNEGIKDLSIFKTRINLNNIRTYSLGTDLSSFSITNFISHNKNIRDFFLNMIVYIKTNHLENDGKVMAMLYGHKDHYFLDVNVHPLVNSLNKNPYNSTVLSNHTLIEGFYDSNLLKKKRKNLV